MALGNLDDDCLLMVLDLLEPKQLFKVLGVNRRINQLATEKLRTKIKAITLNNSNSFSDCFHLDSISQDQVLDLSYNLELDFFQVFNWTGHGPSVKVRLLYVLTKCSGVKCIDFGYFEELNRDFVLEVFRRCPKLEGIKLSKSNIEVDDWDGILDQHGQKVVHFEKDWFDWALSDIPKWSPEVGTRLVEIVAAKCPDIKQFDLVADFEFTSDLLAAIKMLPKNCWIKLQCFFDLNENFVFEDVDELDASELDWSLLGNRVNRLSSLKINNLNRGVPIHGVEFAGLKKLDITFINFHNEELIGCLVASRFPRLKEFDFKTSVGLTENDYNALFQRMKSVKKLTILWFKYTTPNQISQLPGPAIYHLKNLEIIDLKIQVVPNDWQPEDFLQQLEQYVDEIDSLKKLIVDMGYRRDNFEWEKVLEDEVERMKMKQNQVKLQLILDKHVDNQFDDPFFKIKLNPVK